MDKLKGAKYFTKMDIHWGATTTYKSKKEMNGKPLSKQTKDYLSQQ